MLSIAGMISRRPTPSFPPKFPSEPDRMMSSTWFWVHPSGSLLPPTIFPATKTPRGPFSAKICQENLSKNSAISNFAWFLRKWTKSFVVWAWGFWKTAVMVMRFVCRVCGFGRKSTFKTMEFLFLSQLQPILLQNIMFYKCMDKKVNLIWWTWE